ncbi:MAG TPA: methylmalonyl Co-A mutase-associated GTPase MeaB [Candidatus Acidoferrales bacterium]|nr:methylmalonyl Co-A mutase-associated GTPase MeaB [Candidatus Acidoferrales bacterium]
MPAALPVQPMTQNIQELAKQVRAGDVRAISRAMTGIENRTRGAENLLRELFPYTGKSYCIGITGAPGTGKSTLVDRLAAYYRSQLQTVGVIAVDPSSPFTGGAILGDRIRMQGHASDSGVFIRSMATRGSLGGLSQATSDAALLLDAAGKQLVLIETVGVGQGEVEIARLADCTLVVLVPGMGDDVQNLKAGLMEIGDVFVLNKADREGADRFEQQLRAILQLIPERDGWRPPIVLTVATQNEGVAELARQIDRFREHFGGKAEKRAKEISLWKERLLNLLQEQLVRLALAHVSSENLLERLAAEVAERKRDPYSAVNEIMEKSASREKH